VEGRVYAVEIRPVEHNTVLATEIADSTGQLTALFYGRSHIPGVECGARVRFRGQVGMRSGGPVMINPAYELVAAGAPGQGSRRSLGDGDPAQDDSPKRRGPRRRKDR
jgi:RecG-like helicase